MTHATRSVNRSEIDVLSWVLARAFHDDPVFRWMFPEPSLRPKKSASMFSILLRRTLPHGMTHTTEDLEGGALWEFMEHGPAGLLAQIPSGLRMIPVFGLRTFLVFKGLSETVAAHPKNPHWYLLALGVNPAHQRKGLGSALLDPALARCDAEGVAAYLEASRPANIPFYQRHGFSVTRAIHLPKGPTLYGMLRRPVR